MLAVERTHSLPLADTQSEHEKVLSLVPEPFRGQEYSLAHRYYFLVSQSHFSVEDKRTLYSTAAFLLEADKGVMRDSGVPAALHKFQVALMLFGEYHPTGLKKDFSYDDVTKPHTDTTYFQELRALTSEITLSTHQLALLHDVVEDDKRVKKSKGRHQRNMLAAVRSEISSQFGAHIAEKIEKISHLKSRHASKEEYILNVVQTLAEDPEIFFVKILDLYSNVFSLSDLQPRQRDGYTEDTSARIVRKIKEYSFYIPLLLELRHPLSDAICDELLRLQLEHKLVRSPRTVRQAFIDNAHYNSQARGVSGVYEAFLYDLSERVAFDGHRLEFTGTARALDRKKLGHVDRESAHAPTIFIHFDSVPDMHTALDFIQGYSFDSRSMREYLTEMKAKSSSDYVEVYVKMRDQYSVRLVLTSPGYRWLFGRFGNTLYGSSAHDIQDRADLKYRYGQYLSTFTGTAREDLARLSEESGRNLVKVYIVDAQSQEMGLWLPRESTVFDALVRRNSIRGIKRDGQITHLDMLGAPDGQPLHLHSRLFGKDRVHLVGSQYVFSLDEILPFYDRGEIKTRSARRIIDGLLHPRRRLAAQ